MSDPISRVPKELRERYGEIVAHTDRFCKEHLDDEFRDLCRELAAQACRKRLPVTSGKALSWAAGVVYELGQVNFLGDPSQKHHMTGEEMARKLGVSPATMLAKGKVHPTDDFTPIALLGITPQGLCHHPKHKFGTVQALID